MRAIAISTSCAILIAGLLDTSRAEARVPGGTGAALKVVLAGKPPPPKRRPPVKAVPTATETHAAKAAAPAEKSASSAPAGAVQGEVAVGPRGPTRIDFDDRLIQGQTNKSGAVYLFDRKELSVRSMVKQRTSFRDQIVKDILSE
jgi:hypothetical protein